MMDSYRTQMGQMSSSDIDNEGVKKRSLSQSRSPNERFNKKLENKDFDNFSSVDIIKYFQHLAKLAGSRYKVTNIPREAGQVKHLFNTYSPKELCIAIDFIFNSDQTYIDKQRSSLGILCHKWLVSLVPDSQDWVNGNYCSYSKARTKRQSALTKREWGERNGKKLSSIGDWEDE